MQIRATTNLKPACSFLESILSLSSLRPIHCSDPDCLLFMSLLIVALASAVKCTSVYSCFDKNASTKKAGPFGSGVQCEFEFPVFGSGCRNLLSGKVP